MKKPLTDEIQIVPINAEKTIIPLVEQLNGLIDRYNALYSIYAKPLFIPEEEKEKHPAYRLVKVLENIEKAIEALCLQIGNPQFILKPTPNVTYRNIF